MDLSRGPVRIERNQAGEITGYTPLASLVGDSSRRSDVQFRSARDQRRNTGRDFERLGARSDGQKLTDRARLVMTEVNNTEAIGEVLDRYNSGELTYDGAMQAMERLRHRAAHPAGSNR